MKAASVFPSEFNQFATAFCKIWFLLSERSSLLKKNKNMFINLDIAHVQSMQTYMYNNIFIHSYMYIHSFIPRLITYKQQFMYGILIGWEHVN